MLLLNFVPATNSVASTGLPTLRCGSQLAKRYVFRVKMNTLDKLKNRQINIFVVCALLHYLWLAKILMSYEPELKEYGFFPIIVFILVLVVFAHFTERLIAHFLNWFSLKK